MNTATIGRTTKGHRVWLQGIYSHMPAVVGMRYDVHYHGDDITVYFYYTAKRKVTQSKGGIIDIESKKVTEWARGATMARVAYGHNTIIITRGNI